MRDKILANWRHASVGMRRRIGLALLTMLGLLSGTAAAETSPIVIGQSLPLRGAAFFSASRVLQASQAYVGHINDSGGISGRKVELVTLDDENDPARLANNFRSLVQKHRAVVVVNCMGDVLCERASLMANELRLPLFGPVSGARSIRSLERRYTVPLRPQYDLQTEALLKQLKSIGITRVVLLTSYPRSAELRTSLVESFTRGGLEPRVVQLDDADEASLDEAAARLQTAEPQAVVLDITHEALRKLGAREAERKFTWPAVLATVSAGTLTQITKEIRSRIVGFINVVPNPEDQRLPLIRDLNEQADRYAGPEAVTFEGVEAYINIRFAVEAIRRAGGGITPESVLRAAESIQQFDAGGFVVQLRPGRGGPTWVDVGLRARDGSFRR